MSSIARWSYEHGPATVWPVGVDDFGQPTNNPPYLIPAISYQGGGKVRRDTNGTEFIPRQTIGFETEYDSAIVPELDWYIKRGDFSGSASPPTDAERIRAIESYPVDELEPGGIPDWIVTT